jgi:sugar phosphate permease
LRTDVPGDYYKGRWAATVASLLFLSTLMGYISRSTISVALPFISQDYGWTLEQQGFWGGILLGIFLVGYGVSNIFFSPLIDHFGPRKTLAMSIIVWSFITYLTGILGLVFGAFILLRLLLGLSQGVLFPSASKVTRVHFSPHQRSKVNGLYMSSMFISNLLIGLIMLPLIQWTNWQAALLMVAAMGYLLGLGVWFCLEDDTSIERHPRGLREAYADIMTGLKESVHIRGFWRVTIADSAMNLAWWGLSLWLPTYLIDGKGFVINDLVWALPIIYVGGALGILIGSWASDWYGHRSEITAIFSLCGAIFLIFLPLAHSQVEIVLASFAMFFCISLLPANAYTLLQSVTPARLAGSATGLLNGVSNGLGVFGPVIIGMSVALTNDFGTGIIIIALAQLVAAWTIFSFRRFECPKDQECT